MELSELLRSSLFWIASTTLAIIISIAGNLLTPAVERLVARFSRTVSQRRTARKEVVDRFVAYLAADAQRIVSTKIDVLHQLLWSILIQTFAFSAIASDLGILTIFGALLTGDNVHAMRESIQLYGYARDAAEQNATFARNNQDPPESQPPNPPLHPTKGFTPLPSTTDGDSVTSPEESAALRR